MTECTPTRVMIVDDHSIMRDGLQEVLERTGEFEVVGQAADGEEAVNLVESIIPDVIIMDVMMTGKNGIVACREIIERLPGMRVLMLTASNDEDAIVQSIAAGASGYLQKYSGKQKLITTVREVADGEFRIPGEAAGHVFSAVRANRDTTEKGQRQGLTGREQEILTLFSRGLSYAQIAEVTGNKPLSIRNAIYKIERKLGLKTKQEIVVWAVRNGLLDDYSGDGQRILNSSG